MRLVSLVEGRRACASRTDSAADCGDRRKLANDEAVAGEEQDFIGEAEMRESGFAGLEFACVVEVDFGDGFGCVGVEVDAGAMFERRGRAQELKADVDARGGAETVRCG